MMQSNTRVAVIVLGTLLLSSAVSGADVFYDLPFEHITVVKGKLPMLDKDRKASRIFSGDRVEAYAVLDGDGEAFVRREVLRDNNKFSGDHLFIRLSSPRKVTGRLYVTNADDSAMVEVRFEVPAEAAQASARNGFYRAIEHYYASLGGNDRPGDAWFRHVADEAYRTINGKDDSDRLPYNPHDATLAGTLPLWLDSQGAAESLPLAPMVLSGGGGTSDVEAKSIRGPRLPSINEAAASNFRQSAIIDLASAIPADQHGIFFHNLPATIAIFEEFAQNALVQLESLYAGGQQSNTLQRYETQLGFSLGNLQHSANPAWIKGVAITGSDLDLQSGSDIVILFCSDSGEALSKLIASQINDNARNHPGAEKLTGRRGVLAFSGVRDADRSFCSYVAVLKNGVVAVTNSEVQLQHLAEVQEGLARPLASAPDFARLSDQGRYDATQSALLLISGATMQRWHSAVWRIGQSRRIRAAAVMAEMEVRHADSILSGKAQTVAVPEQLIVPGLDAVRITSSGAHSVLYGSRGLLTPISELGIDRITALEAEAYSSWRDGLDTGVGGIALWLDVGKSKIAADLNVSPIRFDEETEAMVSTVSGAAIDPKSADWHDSLAMIGCAFNANSPIVREWGERETPVPFLSINALRWAGPTIWIYADKDPFWMEMAGAADLEDFFEKNASRVPAAIQIDIANPLMATAFIVAFRLSWNSDGPDAVWENVSYKDQIYVKMRPAQAAGDSSLEFPVYYRVMPKTLLISPNENMIRRAIDRELDRTAAREAGRPVSEKRTLTGQTFFLHADAAAIDVLERLIETQFHTTYAQAASWKNLPILNEFRRTYRGQDPMRVYERLFHSKPIDPAGGEYRWNEQWQTMESSVFGSPASPGENPPGITALARLVGLDVGVTLSQSAVRVRLDVQRK